MTLFHGRKKFYLAILMLASFACATVPPSSKEHKKDADKKIAGNNKSTSVATQSQAAASSEKAGEPSFVTKSKKNEAKKTAKGTKDGKDGKDDPNKLTKSQDTTHPARAGSTQGTKVPEAKVATVAVTDANPQKARTPSVPTAASKSQAPSQAPKAAVPTSVFSDSSQCLSGETPAHSQFSREQLNLLLNSADEEQFRAGQRYSFDFIDSNIRDAFQELSLRSKVAIVLDENVTGVVTLSVRHQTLLGAMQMLVSTGPFDFKYNGSFFYVGMLDPRAESWRKLSVSFQYKLRHATPSAVLKLINPLYKSAAQADDALGVISVVAPKSIMTEILQIIDGVDRGSRQVLLKMSIAEISAKGHAALGRYLNSMGNAYGAIDGLAPLRPAFGSAVLTHSAITDFLTSLSLLNRQGKADIKAQPKIIVQDGEKAIFKSDVHTLISNATGFTSSLNFVNTGTEMTLIPNIVENDEIALNILEAKTGDFDFDNSQQVNEHIITTKVRVKPGQSLLLGGMLSKKKVKIVSKIPWLGDIPVLGWLFRSESSDIQTVEIVFTITPEIVCGG